MTTFAEKVKAARSELGMTQSELGDAAGVSLRSVLDYEKGKKVPRQSTLLRLAKALQVSTRFLMDDTCDNPLADIEKDGFISEARKRFGSRGAIDMDRLLTENTTLFAGGEFSQDQKDAFFQAIMTAYVQSKEAAKQTFGRKKKH